MLLVTFDFETAQDFSITQNFFLQHFHNQYEKRCINFTECGRKENEISFLFIEKAIRIFYSIPKCEEYDTIIVDDNFDTQSFLTKCHETFCGNIDLSAHISYTEKTCPAKTIFHYVPDEWKDTDEELLNYLLNNEEGVSCSLYTSPNTSKEILFMLNTYDEDMASIPNTIDGKNKSDFIPRFFSLVSILNRR